ncbi:MAG: hypothetical protein INR64_18040 [Caulobacteraceae bacterium]|nr:hypothetical protein [Caulobacter sp.]
MRRHLHVGAAVAQQEGGDEPGVDQKDERDDADEAPADPAPAFGLEETRVLRGGETSVHHLEVVRIVRILVRHPRTVTSGRARAPLNFAFPRRAQARKCAPGEPMPQHERAFGLSVGRI